MSRIQTITLATMHSCVVFCFSTVSIAVHVLYVFDQHALRCFRFPKLFQLPLPSVVNGKYRMSLINMLCESDLSTNKCRM